MEKWGDLRSRFPVEMQFAELHITSPGYGEVSHRASLAQEWDNFRIKYIENLPPRELAAYMATCEGLFYVNTFPETFCAVAAIADAVGCKPHILCKNGVAGIADVIPTAPSHGSRSLVDGRRSGIRRHVHQGARRLLGSWAQGVERLPRVDHPPAVDVGPPPLSAPNGANNHLRTAPRDRSGARERTLRGGDDAFRAAPWAYVGRACPASRLRRRGRDARGRGGRSAGRWTTRVQERPRARAADVFVRRRRHRRRCRQAADGRRHGEVAAQQGGPFRIAIATCCQAGRLGRVERDRAGSGGPRCLLGSNADGSQTKDTRRRSRA